MTSETQFHNLIVVAFRYFFNCVVIDISRNVIVILFVADWIKHMWHFLTCQTHTQLIKKISKHDRNYIYESVSPMSFELHYMHTNCFKSKNCCETFCTITCVSLHVNLYQVLIVSYETTQTNTKKTMAFVQICAFTLKLQPALCRSKVLSFGDLKHVFGTIWIGTSSIDSTNLIIY